MHLASEEPVLVSVLCASRHGIAWHVCSVYCTSRPGHGMTACSSWRPPFSPVWLNGVLGLPVPGQMGMACLRLTV